MKILVLMFALVVSCVTVCGAEYGDYNIQDDPFSKIENRSQGEGAITIRQSSDLQNLVKLFIDQNRSADGVEGYRIQLYSGTGAEARREAAEIRSKVLGQFEDEHILVEYNAPFWRVRVGAYRHKHEALPTMQRLSEKFPSCYIVRDSSIDLDEFEK
ncbi:SPOR domain-containing protein [Marinilabiliaceae bacterium ANBcel2]|nr:SPOR domain-containing protein [Marinilabiliaceae bacterium ANBcel2]